MERADDRRGPREFEATAGKSTPPKKAWQAPRLSAHGRIPDLTFAASPLQLA